MLSFEKSHQDNHQDLSIKVIGIGGGGGNALKEMMSFNIPGVELICANTDMQALNESPIKTKVQLGETLTKGRGAGSLPEVGRDAAEESREHLRQILSGADIVFIATGMGGGTGTGASPVIANIAREIGILTFAVVTKPFAFEGKSRMKKAEEGLKRLRDEVDCLLVIPNDRISEQNADKRAKSRSGLDSFAEVNYVLRDGVMILAEIIQKTGLINIDMADVKTLMLEKGVAMFGIGQASGENRAQIAVEKAISSKLLENTNISKAKGIIVGVTAPPDYEHDEYLKVGEVINDLADEDAEIKFGLFIQENQEDIFKVAVYATGIEENDEEKSSNSDFLSSIFNNNAIPMQPMDAPPTFSESAPRRFEEEEEKKSFFDFFRRKK